MTAEVMATVSAITNVIVALGVLAGLVRYVFRPIRRVEEKIGTIETRLSVVENDVSWLTGNRGNRNAGTTV